MSFYCPQMPGIGQEYLGREILDENLERERRIQTALKRLDDARMNGQKYSIRAAARDYALPASTLKDRFNKASQPRALAFQHLQRLTPAQELALVRHIKDQDDYGYPPTRQSILEMATTMLPDDKPLGVNWHEGFEDRHPDIRKILSSALDRQRALSNTVTGYEIYWENLVSIIIKYNIPPENIWNFDEKGFIIGLCGRYIVYCRRSRENPGRLPQTGNRQSTTDGETISAAGKVIPPYIINRGKVHTANKFRYVKVGVLDGASFANAPEGVMHANLSIDYFEHHFERHTRPLMKTAAQGGSDHRVLLWDSHASHTTLDVRYFGVSQKIHLCTYPGHQTHKLQPLDVGIFSPLQHAYNMLLQEWTDNNRYCAMGQAEFFLLLSRAREIAITEKNIQSAFAATGMVPFKLTTLISNRLIGIFPLSKEKIMSLIDHDSHRREASLLDTPVRLGSHDQARAARFATPPPLKTYNPNIQTPGNPFQVEG